MYSSTGPASGTLLAGGGFTGATANLENNVIRIKEIGPIATTSTGRYLCMADMTYTSTGTNHITTMTIARATTSGATGGASTNLANLSPISSGITGANQYVATHLSSRNADTICSLTGFTIDNPGVGTFYYSVWGFSENSVSSENVDFSVLNVLQ